MIVKILGMVGFAVVSLFTGAVLGLMTINAMIEPVSFKNDSTASRYVQRGDLKAGDSTTSMWNGEHYELQPALGYRAVQASEVPLQRTEGL